MRMRGGAHNRNQVVPDKSIWALGENEPHALINMMLCSEILETQETKSHRYWRMQAKPMAHTLDLTNWL